MLRIGMGHRSGHGKDTAAKFLLTHLRTMIPGLRVRKINFADKMKDITFQLYEWAGVQRAVHYDNCREDRAKKIPALDIDIVSLWVQVGEKLREVDPEIWVRYWRENDHGADVLIAADLRQPNETTCCQERFRIFNPRVPNREGLSIDDRLEDYRDWTVDIMNDGDLRHLNSLMKTQAERLIDSYGLDNKPV